MQSTAVECVPEARAPPVAPFETALRMLTTDASYHYFIDQYHIGGGQELIRTSDLRRHSCVCLYFRLFKCTSELE